MRHLRLKGVGLDKCPRGIERLNKLETLEMSDNRIEELEQSTASLFKLKLLDLSGNNIPVRVTNRSNLRRFPEHFLHIRLFTVDSGKHARERGPFFL